MLPVILYRHMHLADIVAPLVDGLDKEFLYKHLATDYHLDGVYRCIHRTVA